MSKKPSREDMIERAWSLLPAIKERAAKTESLQKVHDDTAKDFHETGLWRIVQPARVGGGEYDYNLIMEVSDITGRGCGSTSWALSNLSSHHWMIGQYDKRAQDAVWDENPDALTATSLIYPCGRAKKVKGGYELSGHWPFCSGIDLCDWIIVGGLVEATDGNPPEARMFLVPVKSLKVLDTWDVVGLAGTGSKDSTVDELFVPDFMTLAASEAKGDVTPGSEVNPGPLFRLPVAALFPHLIAGPILGMAAGIYDHVVNGMRSKISTYNKSKVADHATIQLRISEAEAGIQAGRLLMRDNCVEATRLAEAGQVPDIEAKMRWRRDAAYAATLSARGANQLYQSSGGGAIYNKNPLQRMARDMNAGMVHIGVSMDVSGVAHGRVALGLESDNPNV